MQLSFETTDSADAGLLARELDLALKREGLPGSVTSIIRSNPDSMDLGTVLGIDVNAALHALGSIGYIALFGKCIYEIIGKHHITIRIKTQHGSVDIPEDADMEKIERILASLQGDETKG